MVRRPLSVAGIEPLSHRAIDLLEEKAGVRFSMAQWLDHAIAQSCRWRLTTDN
jgi:hypothetical protein